MVACALTLLAGHLLKSRCSNPGSHQYRDLCYNDIQPLYLVRGVAEHDFPYVGGGLEDGELVDSAIEYPVLTGVFMWASGYFAQDFVEYLEVSALLLAPFAFLSAYWLARIAGLRALLFAGSSAMVLYAFHNWDLLVVAASTAGIWMWWRGRFTWAAVLFGVGAALKMYPGLFLLPLFFDRVTAGDKREGLRSLAAGVGTVVAINLPFAIADFEGWWTTYGFHSQRLPNYDTIWLIGFNPDAVADPSVPLLNFGTAALTVSSIGIALVWAARRTRTEGIYPFVQASGAILCSFLLWNKVHSPQYALWLMPFFVLIGVRVVWWIAYSIADLMVYVGVFRWFYDFGATQDLEQTTFAKGLLVAGVWVRAALLVLLFIVFMKAPPEVDKKKLVTTGPEPPG
ncbi:MAG: glycosyltransferase 87 family protein [Actinomycetota bacterium]|nr:glycosyltransferase 87 family protein [Actinomycetota bacterium]